MLNTALGNGIGYEGKVTLTLKSNNHVLESRTYKNNGTAQLFKFLGYCLIDSFNEAKNLMPNKIRLLYNSSSVGADPRNVDVRSDEQPLASSPTIISDSATQSVKVVYSFEVAKNAITGVFNQVALYGAGMGRADYKDFSAYHYLTDSTGQPETIDASLWSATTVLLIEWELTLSNKNVETNNSGKEDS